MPSESPRTDPLPVDEIPTPTQSEDAGTPEAVPAPPAPPLTFGPASGVSLAEPTDMAFGMKPSLAAPRLISMWRVMDGVGSLEEIVSWHSGSLHFPYACLEAKKKKETTRLFICWSAIGDLN